MRKLYELLGILNKEFGDGGSSSTYLVRELFVNVKMSMNLWMFFCAIRDLKMVGSTRSESENGDKGEKKNHNCEVGKLMDRRLVVVGNVCR